MCLNFRKKLDNLIIKMSDDLSSSITENRYVQLKQQQEHSSRAAIQVKLEVLRCNDPG